MKKNYFKMALIIVVAISIASCCGLHSGYMANSASLSSANFSYTKMNCKGTSHVQYILGIGGLERTNLVNAAKQNLLLNNPLEANQVLANITVNFKDEIYLGIYRKVTCIVAADIVTFNKPNFD